MSFITPGTSACLPSHNLPEISVLTNYFFFLSPVCPSSSQISALSLPLLFPPCSELNHLCGAKHMGELPLTISSMGVVKSKPAKMRTAKPYGEKDAMIDYVAGNALVAYIPMPLKTPYSDKPYDGQDELQGLLKAKIAWFNDYAVFPDYGYNGAGVPAPKGEYAMSKADQKRLKALPEVEPGTLNLLLKKDERHQY